VALTWFNFLNEGFPEFIKFGGLEPIRRFLGVAVAVGWRNTEPRQSLKKLCIAAVLFGKVTTQQ
jgi:hypothetical protein